LGWLATYFYCAEDGRRADIAEAVKTFGLVFSEKPVRMSILSATLALAFAANPIAILTSPHPLTLVRPALPQDYAAWKPLWDGYNAFYGREGETALADDITQITWRHFFDPAEPMGALVAEREGRLVGLAHYLFHRSTLRTELSCYLNDLFTLESERGRGVGRSLVEALYELARSAGTKRVYWHTHETNHAGRLLYDKLAAHTGFIVYSVDL
jgi:GNAT superfamily N-acetyltransferase